MKVKIQYAYTRRNALDESGATTETAKVGEYEVDIAEVSSQLAPIAIKTRHASSGGSSEKDVLYRWFANAFWTTVMTFGQSVAFDAKSQDDSYKIETTMRVYWDYTHPHNDNAQIFRSGLHIRNGLTETEVREVIDSWAAGSLLIDRVFHGAAREPRYVIQTSGVEHRNGTVWLVTADWYSALVPSTWYFSALQLEQAIQMTRTLAVARDQTIGDRVIPNRIIDVLIPHAIRVNPALQHAVGELSIEEFEIVSKQR